MNKGLLYAIGAYTIWGVMPIYWKALKAVPAPQIFSHRIVWTLVFVVILVAYGNHWNWLNWVRKQPKTLITIFSMACLLTVNWLTYIWAVNAGYIVETSLGYFINPLVSVVLGMIFFGERLRLWQGVAVGIAFMGVLYLTVNYGALPWIALTLAFSFGFYGLLKKKVPLRAVNGLSLEMSVLVFPALGYLIYQDQLGVGAFGRIDIPTTVLLVLTGLATGLPLLLFSAAAQKIPLSMLGILQYIAPTLQFLVGVLIYHEAFTQVRMVGFSLVWVALLVYSIEGVVTRRRAAALRYAS